jgi:hypothetical protein
MKLASVLPNLGRLAPVKAVPVIVTIVPPVAGPLLGEEAKEARRKSPGLNRAFRIVVSGASGSHSGRAR